MLDEDQDEDQEMVDVCGMDSEPANEKGGSGRDSERTTESRVR